MTTPSQSNNHAPELDLPEADASNLYTHMLTLSVGVNSGEDWDAVYRVLTATAADLGIAYPYVSVSSVSAEDAQP